jgi:hypothetical protein
MNVFWKISKYLTGHYTGTVVLLPIPKRIWATWSNKIMFSKLLWLKYFHSPYASVTIMLLLFENDKNKVGKLKNGEIKNAKSCITF